MASQSPTAAGAHSLADLHASVETGGKTTWLRRALSFSGPAYLVSVGYMDPGNWATDLEGGARFGYQLLWVLLTSNLMAVLLQTLSSRLGIVTRRDLAQACRDEYPRAVSFVLWMLSELAIVACDLAEVIGAAIGLNLLFKIPVLFGVLITAADTLLILWFTRYGIRAIEALVIVLIATIAACFGVEIWLAKPSAQEVFGGMLPRLNGQSLYVAVGILGATVMPHNLYLHSALVQTRRFGEKIQDLRAACRFNFYDSLIALNAAFLVNAAILIMAAAVFFKHGIVVTEIQQAHALLSPILGTTLASILFGAALLCSGQSSTLTGTMAGQIVMEGFLHFKMQPWLRRLITRLLAIIPAAATIWLAGEKGMYQLLILSQVVLSIQLPFAVVPLVHLTGDRRRMGELVNPKWVQLLAWLTAASIVSLNAYLAYQIYTSALHGANRWIELLSVLSAFLIAGLLLLLAALIAWPMLRRTRARAAEPVAVPVDAFPAEAPLAARQYERILVPLDHTPSDHEALANAIALAKPNGARILLLHIEEGVTSRMFGAMASTAEVEEGKTYLEQAAGLVRSQGLPVEFYVSHGGNPAKEISLAAERLQPDLLVIAAHGHRGLKDLIFGSTINKVRHNVHIPMLVVQGKRG